MPPRLFRLALAAAGLATAINVSAQTTAFTYQGRLQDGGNPATGSYDLTFALYSVSSGAGQLGGTLTNAATAVSNGLFTVALDFGANFPGADRWLELGVRTNGGGSFTLLTPRQKITSAPYAVTALNAASATSAGSLTGTLPAAQITGNLPATQLSGTLPAAQFSGNYSNAVALTNGGNSFAGNGTGLTNVNASTVGGIGTNGFWQSSGNTGLVATNGNFLGTRDNQPLELRVNNQRALRLEPTAGAPNVIGGGINNSATAATGGSIGGGTANTNGGTAATVPGGSSNAATGDFSFAAGQRAKAAHPGAFVWADSQPADFASLTNDQFSVRAGGGVRIVTTNAANTNGVGMTLDGLPVLVGSGVGVLAWQVVPGASAQAQNHYGYILTNTQPVTVTLPASASMNIGDTIAVSGGGTGGWKIAQNAGQAILAGNFSIISGSTSNWTPIGNSVTNCRALAASSDGSRLVAARYGGGIYTSVNGGNSWTQTVATTQLWTSLASSADGNSLLAVASFGGIFLSTNAGATWSSGILSGVDWQCAASSADGKRLLAGIETGGALVAFVWMSTNYGASWTRTSLISGYWQALGSSADGSVLLAGQANGTLYRSTDSGANWFAINSPGSPGTINCTALTVSADGSRMAAVANPGGIFTSADAGNNWTTTTAPSTNWTSLAASADGMKLVAGVSSGPIYSSDNGGVTWKISNPTSGNWTALSASVDGGRLAGAAYASGISIFTAAQRTTTVGPAGYLSGGQNSAVQLQYAGLNLFLPISHEGIIFVY